MSIERFFTTPVTIVTSGSTNSRYNDEAPDWDNPISSVDALGWLTQTSSAEQIGGRDVVVTVDRLFLPAGTAVTVADRVVSEGRIYAVDGDPHVAQSPRGAHHVEVELRLVSEVIED